MPTDFATRVAAVIEQGKAIGLDPAWDRSDHILFVGPYESWRARTIVILRDNLPQRHEYLAAFERVTHHEEGKMPRERNRDSGVEILQALEQDLVGGLEVGLRQLIEGSVFSDFLEMAQHLLAQNYHHAAASVAGAVLEDALRRHLTAMGVKSIGNLESLNDIARDKGVYSQLDATQVKVWIGIRNAADHARWDEVGREQVALMIQGITQFLRAALELP